MADVFFDLARTVAKAGAPILGGLLQNALPGPAGKLAGGAAEKIIGALAEELGTEPDAGVVKDALDKADDAGEIVARVEVNIAAMVPVWLAEETRLKSAQDAEIERGFSSWNARRNVAHYGAWGLFAFSGLATLVMAFMGHPQAEFARIVFATSAGVTTMWTAANSGGRAVTDAVKAWRGG